MRRALALALLLAGCAIPPKWPSGRALLHGVTPELPKAPDSLRASLELTALAGGHRSSVTAAFSAKPGKAYKLDLFGFPGVTAGGFLWRPETWQLVVYDREEYLEGSGDRVEIGAAGIGQAPVHDLFSWLWGDFFPGDSALAGLPAGWARAPEGGIAYRGSDGEWRADLDPETGLPRWVARSDSAFRFEFGAWRLTKAESRERPVPRRVRIFRYGVPMLEIKVSLVEDDPAWKRDPFVLRIPKGFRRAERLQG